MKTKLTLTVIVVIALSAVTPRAQDDLRASSSMYLPALSKPDVTVPFDVAAEGQRFNPTWGLDQAWLWDRNLFKGINHMGKENIGVGRSAFRFTQPLVNDTELADDQTKYLKERSNMFNNVSPTLPIIFTADQEAGTDSYYVTSKTSWGRTTYTANADRWAALLNTAHYDWEEIDYQMEDYQARYPRAYREYLQGYAVQTQNYDTIGYLRQMANYEYKLVRKVVPRNADGYVALDADGNYEVSVDADNIDGRDVILQKLDLVRTWLKDNWGVDLDELRREVQSRQYVTDAEGNFLRDNNGNFVNRLTYVDPANPDQPTLIEQLLQEVEEYKKLQIK
mgnify:CR=1 FL=1